MELQRMGPLNFPNCWLKAFNSDFLSCLILLPSPPP